MVRARRVSENCFTAMNLGVRARYCGCQGRHHPWFLRGHARTEPTPAGVWERSESVNYVQGVGGKQVCQGQRGGPEPAAGFTLLLHSTRHRLLVPGARRLVAVGLGLWRILCESRGRDGQQKASDECQAYRFHMRLLLPVGASQDARRQNASLGWAFRVQTFTSAPFLFAVCYARRMAETFRERYPPSCV